MNAPEKSAQQGSSAPEKEGAPAQEAQNGTHAKGMGRSASPRHIGRILVVDDNEAGRYALAHCLRRSGHEVQEAGTGEECLKHIASGKVDLVLLDIKLPDISGIEVCKRLKTEPATARIPVIQISAFLTATENRIEGLESGADAYLVSPFEPRELLAHVEGLLRVRRAEERLRLDIVERRKAEEALRASEAKYRIVASNTYDWEFWSAPDGSFIYCSPSCERISGHRAEEFLRDPGLRAELIHPEDRQRFDEHVRNVEERHVAGEGEWRTRRIDGSWRWLAHVCQPVFDEQGAYLGCRGSNRDVTDHKQAEEKLRESEERRKVAEAVAAERQRLHDVLEAMPAMVCLLTPDYHVAFANRAFREKFGEARGRHCYEYCFGLKAPCEFCESYSVLETGKPHQWEVTGPDGSVIAAHDFPFKDLDGSPLILEMDLDITEMRKTQTALKAASAYNRSLVEASLDPLVAIGPSGKITDVNEATELATGCSRAELIGTDFSEYFTEPERARAGYQQVFREGFVRDYLLDLRHRDGRVTSVLYNASVYRDENGHVVGVFAAARDITAQKRAEEALREANEGLERRVAQRTAELRASEGRFRQVFEHASLGIAVGDSEGRILESNPALEQLLGYSKAELRQKRFSDFTHPDDLGKEWSLIQEVAAGKRERYEIEKRCQRKDGQAVLVRVCGSVTRAENGQDLRGIALIEDITERKRAENELRRGRELGDAANRISQVLHSTLDSNEVIRRIVEEGTAALASETAGISERKDGGWLVRYVHGLAAPVLGQRLEDEQERHAALAIQTGEVVPVSDGFNDERFNREHLRRYNVRSVLVAPLIIRGEPFGVVFFNYHQKPHVFTEGELNFARLLAGAAASALENARLFEEQQLAEKAVRQSEERLRRMIETSPVAIGYGDSTGRIFRANESFYRLTGYSREEIAARQVGWNQLTAPEYAEIDRHIMTMLATTGRAGPYEKEYIRKDGSRMPLMLTVSKMPDRDEHVAFIFDITERKQAAEALKQSEERLRLAKTAGKIGIHDYDPVTGVLHWDERLRELWALGPEDPVSYNVFMAGIHPDDRTATDAAVQRALDPAGDGYCYVEYRLVRGGQVRWIAATGRATFEGGRATRLVGTVLDITERKAFQAELERLVKERTARLQELVGELEHFSYTITHDMRAPLRAMKGFGQAVSEMCEEWDKPEAKEFLRRIMSSADRMDALIRDALNYSSSVRQELPLEDVDTGELLRGMLDSYPEFQESRAHIRVDGKLPVVLGNEAALTQCFSNLLGNAVKFVEPGKLPEIRVWAEEREGWARLWVEDKGIGISKEMLPRIFDMFSRASRNYEGTGIGLALVRKVMQRMGGRVGVESEEGKGSRFWLELKAGKGEAIMGMRTRANSEPSGGTVLYVEDEETDAVFMERAFVKKGLGPALRLVKDGRAAIEYLSGAGRYGERKDYPLPGLVLLDLNLPEVPGFEVLRWMRNHPDFAATPVVVFSSSTREDDRQKARDMGANDYVAKPQSGLEFAGVVEALKERWLNVSAECKMKNEE